MAIAVSFPSSQPNGFAWLDDEPEFDPAEHLRLEMPDQILKLVDFGYSTDQIRDLPTDIACSSPFRLLSSAGAEIMLQTARRLRQFATPAGNRIEHVVRGGCYRSKWLRDLALDESVSAHLSTIYGVEVAPHPMGHHLGHLNYEPSSLEKSIDKWHHDTLPLDYVMTVTDPADVAGGRFEYFLGTKDEAAALAAEGRTPPLERRGVPEFAGPGYAIALHGNMIVHRAGALDEMCERISMVNGYVATNVAGPDQSRSRDLIGIDPDDALWAEWARFASWRSHQRLATLIDSLPFTSDKDAVLAELRSAIDDVSTAISEIEAGPKPADHYEQ